MPELSGLVHLLIWVIVIGLIAWLIIYLTDQLPLPPPFKMVVRVIVILILLLVVLTRLLPMVGVP